MSKTWCFQVITTNWQIPGPLSLYQNTTCKNATVHQTVKATFETGCQITDNSRHRLQAFLFIYSSWLWFCSQDFLLWLWGRTLTRDLLLSHWFEEAGRPSSYLVTGCDPPQNGKARSLMSAAERRWWCVGNVRCWRPIPLAPAWAERGCPRGPCHQCCLHECGSVCVWKENNIQYHIDHVDVYLGIGLHWLWIN